jgi:hypothetical protein
MPAYPILHRWTGMPIALLEGEDFLSALELAARQPAKLLYANLAAIRVPGARLRKADLRGAELSRSDLSGALLAEADLRTTRLVLANLDDACLHGANLRQADLRSADLRGTDLRRARLVGADFRGALLQGAKLEGALLDWRFSELPLEILRRQRDVAGPGSKVVSALAFDENAREFARLRTLLRTRSWADWALPILAHHVCKDDNAPELLRRLVADLPTWPEGPPVAESRMLWTRRASVRAAAAQM